MAAPGGAAEDDADDDADEQADADEQLGSALASSYVDSNSELERICSNSNFFLTFAKSFSEKFDNFCCEISGNWNI